MYGQRVAIKEGDKGKENDKNEGKGTQNNEKEEKEKEDGKNSGGYKMRKIRRRNRERGA